MLYTKVKLFQSVASVSPGGFANGSVTDLEDQINEFLLDNPRVKLVDVKLTSNAAPVGNTVTNYGCIALLIYEES